MPVIWHEEIIIYSTPACNIQLRVGGILFLLRPRTSVSIGWHYLGGKGPISLQYIAATSALHVNSSLYFVPGTHVNVQDEGCRIFPPSLPTGRHTSQQNIMQLTPDTSDGPDDGPRVHGVHLLDVSEFKLAYRQIKSEKSYRCTNSGWCSPPPVILAAGGALTNRHTHGSIGGTVALVLVDSDIG